MGLNLDGTFFELEDNLFNGNGVIDLGWPGLAVLSPILPTSAPGI
jgi:hypothetical protein